MTNRNSYASQSKPFKKAFSRQTQFAFLTITATIFCLICCVASLYMKTARVSAHADISASTSQPEEIFERAIAQEIMDDTLLLSHLQQSAQQTGISIDDQLHNIDLDKIRHSFDFRVAPNNFGNQFRLYIAYNGKGTKTEQALTDSLLQAVSARLEATDTLTDTFRAFDQRYNLVQGKIEAHAQQLHNELSETNGMIDRLNVGLSDLHRSIEAIRPNANGNSMTSLAGTNSETDDVPRLTNLPSAQGSTSSASVRILNAAVPESNSTVKAVLDSLDLLDTDSLKARIGHLQNNLRNDTIQLREDVNTLKSTTSGFNDSRFVINDISASRILPIDNFPNLGHLFLFGLVSVVIGGYVAANYQPELENRGFESTDAVTNSLGIPVVSQIAGDGEQTESTSNWSNRAVRISEICLFSGFLLVVILCMLQTDIRVAFLDNPFYGLSKITNLVF